MTQAITTYDIVNNSKFMTDSLTAKKGVDSLPKGVADTDLKSKFNSILDKTVERKDCTIGDMKNMDIEWDMSGIIENFREILAQAVQEVNMEKSLDLTLARDITEIIDQLQSAISGNFDSINQCAVENDTDILTKELQSEIIAEKDAAIAKTAESAVDALSEDTGLNLDEDMLSELNIESVSAETDSFGGDTMAQQESPEEFGVKVMLNQNIEKFEVNIDKSIGNNSVKTADISSEKIIEQLTKHFDSLKSTSKVNIVLNPESLGKVNLQIVNSKGALSAQFTVTTNEARDLLMKGLDGLKEALLTQGVSVDNLLVKVSETEEAYNLDWMEKQNSEGGNKGQGKQNREEKEKGLFEKTMAENLKHENGNV